MVLGANIMDDNKDTRYCFNFAWIPGWGGEMLNCSKSDYPCIDNVIGMVIFIDWEIILRGG